MSVFQRETTLAVRCLGGTAVVLGVLAALGLLTPLGGWIERLQLPLRLLGPLLFLGLLVVARLRNPWLRWLLALLCAGGVAGWLALLIVPDVPAEQRTTALGAVAVVAMGVVLFVLLERQGRKQADDPRRQARTKGDPRWN